MAETTIEWADFTFNPWEGCTKVSPGCDNCYAEARDKRFTGGSLWGAKAPRRRTSAANWKKPLQWNAKAKAEGRRYRVFCASLADVFDNHRSILPEWRADLWALIAATPHLDWLLLTKRPQNIANMLPVPFDFEKQYPNVWLGTTVENQTEADRRIPHLLAVPAAVRFLSVEPMLGPVDILRPDLGGQYCAAKCANGCMARGDEECPKHTDPAIDWVICGGESGPHARPMHPAWARSLRDQCQAAGVAFHFKQWGEWLPFGQAGFTTWYAHTNAAGNIRRPKGKWWGHAYFNDGAGGPNTHAFGPVETRIIDKAGWQAVRLGKARAGRKLDGRTWDQMPGVNHG